MFNERILDLGVGKGGSYILNDFNRGVLRFGMDHNKARFRYLNKVYPEVLPCASDLGGYQHQFFLMLLSRLMV